MVFNQPEGAGHGPNGRDILSNLAFALPSQRREYASVRIFFQVLRQPLSLYFYLLSVTMLVVTIGLTFAGLVGGIYQQHQRCFGK